MLQGWNNVYTMTEEVSEGCPVYHLDEYTLYFTIPIIGATLKRVNGIWRLQRDCDSIPLTIQKYGATPQGDPFGRWTRGASVEPVD